MIDREPDIILGWCGYCKGPVYENEHFEYEEQGGKYYHQFCYNQKYFFEYYEEKEN